MTPVDLGRLAAPQLAQYVSNADRRIVSGFRLALASLDIAIPDYAQRGTPGRPPIEKLMEQVDRDTGTIATYHDEKRKIGVFAPCSK
ncbi:hypothetical protein [Sphingobium sp. Z007]|uniref:hypothetical protein n=1 Tax=Sphingobium sp. Z007 TaxID=627495 RepID=UPI000B49AC33|nr:hypothetical protein [Sphingobium sp. Z007]